MAKPIKIFPMQSIWNYLLAVVYYLVMAVMLFENTWCHQALLYFGVDYLMAGGGEHGRAGSHFVNEI